MIELEKLCYVRLGVDDVGLASDFAKRIVGLQPVAASDGTVMFRSDFRDHTLEFYPSKMPEQTLAVEVRSTDALVAAAEHLRAAGYEFSMSDASACQSRRVKALGSFRIRKGPRIELVVRPLHSGWRYFASRDSAITEFFGVAFASTDVEADIKLWTTILGGRVSDYVGEAAYISIDGEHHRIAIHPSASDRLLEVQFKLEGLHELMQNSYFLQSAQIPIVHGPGRRPTSKQVFLSFKGSESVLFGFVAEGDKIIDREEHRPRQFPRETGAFCCWGSLSDLPEFSA